MPIRHAVLTLAVLLGSLGDAQAGKGMLELVPGDAAAALTIRNLHDLKKKGDKLVADADAKGLPRISQLFDEIYRGLGVRGGVDEEGSAAIVLVNPKLFQIELFNQQGTPTDAALSNLPNLLVGALPFRDLDKLAKNFGFEKGELKPETMAAGQATPGHMHFFAHGNHLFLGFSEKAVRNVVRGARAGAGLSALQRKQLDEADVFVHIRREPIAPVWAQFLHHGVQEKLTRAPGENLPKEQAAAADQAVRGLIDTLNTIDTVSWAVRVGPGMGVQLLATYPNKGGDTARSFLKSLTGTGTADLKGLPEGHAIAAQAWRANGLQQAAVARMFIHALHDLVLQTKLDLSAADEPAFVGVFNEVWQRLRGSRLAVYQNRDPHAHGLLSAVAILDTDEDASRFVAAMKHLARLAGSEQETSKVVDHTAEIERLVHDLGAGKFRVREAATTQLALIGQSALPHLEKALKSDDLEVVRRARMLKSRIVSVAVERRKELLSHDLMRRLHPTLAFASRPEMHEGQAVELVRLQVPGAKPANIQALQSVFGVDWDKIRLVAQGHQVVALVGSDKELLWSSLKNLREGKPGLAASPSLKDFQKHADSSRQIEFHLSLAAARALLTGADLAQPKANTEMARLTSFALTASADALRIDFWMPTAEIKVLEIAGQSR